MVPQPDIDVEGMVATGAAVVVATVDTDGRTEITRGWDLKITGDGSAEVCISAPQESRMLSNLKSTRLVAINLVHPMTYSSTQLKGAITGVREQTAEDEARVESHVEAFSAAVNEVGLEGVEALRLADLSVITVEVSAWFDQTPGAQAGRQIS